MCIYTIIRIEVVAVNKDQDNEIDSVIRGNVDEIKI